MWNDAFLVLQRNFSGSLWLSLFWNPSRGSQNKPSLELRNLKPKCRSTGCCSRTEWISGRKSRPGLTLTMIYQLSRPLTRLVTNSDRLQACEVCRCCCCCVAKIQTSAFQEITSILTELRRVQRQLEGELSGTTCSHTHTLDANHQTKTFVMNHFLIVFSHQHSRGAQRSDFGLQGFGAVWRPNLEAVVLSRLPDGALGLQAP